MLQRAFNEMKCFKERERILGTSHAKVAMEQVAMKIAKIKRTTRF
jgi:hypothetical protein